MKRLQMFFVAFFLGFAFQCEPVQKQDSLKDSFGGYEFNDVEGKTSINFSINHDRIRGAVKGGKSLDDKGNFNYPFWDIDGESNFGGGWSIHFEYYDEVNPVPEGAEKYTAGYFKTFQPEKSFRDEESVEIVLFTRDKHNGPFTCRIGMDEDCGLRVVVGPLDLEATIDLWATSGTATFTHLEHGSKGKRIAGSFEASDGKHFTIKVDFDTKVVKVDKGG